MIHTGDCIEVMATLEEASIDAVLADPPYGIGFMGHEWDQPGEHGPVRKGPSPAAGHYRERAARRFVGDHTKTTERSTSMEAGRYDLSLTANQRYQSWCETWAREALRILRPGGHMLVFGGTRTWHRMAAGVEDAGFEVRDCLMWGYASGFPKSLDVGRAIDMDLCVLPGRHYGRTLPPEDRRRPDDHVCPDSPEGTAHDGQGTALKPAWEPILLARKPLRDTVARSVLEEGTGALNIDAARIGGPEGQGGGAKASSGFVEGYEQGDGFVASDVGRWPANIVLTDPLLDGDYPVDVVGGGWQESGGAPARRAVEPGGEGITRRSTFYDGGPTGLLPADKAGRYSRFFLIPKASIDDREPVLAALPLRPPPGWSSGEQSPGTFQSQPTPARQNIHPTVKPVLLMRHLVRLVTPPGGIVLDPFLGSGTTAVAAEDEGYRWVGIEREPEYVAIAEARLLHRDRGMGLDVGAPQPPRKTSRSHWPARRGAHKAEGWGFSGGQDGLLERTEGEP